VSFFKQSFCKQCTSRKLFFYIIRGGGPNTNSPEAFLELNRLKSEIELLDNQEKCLDEQIKYLQTNRDLILEDDETVK
jgi:hypothetical protein